MIMCDIKLIFRQQCVIILAFLWSFSPSNSFWNVTDLISTGTAGSFKSFLLALDKYVYCTCCVQGFTLFIFSSKSLLFFACRLKRSLYFQNWFEETDNFYPAKMFLRFCGSMCAQCDRYSRLMLGYRLWFVF